MASQLGQDTWVLSQIHQPSWYCDVGASDGVYFSNTQLLEANGWLGICVEPSSAFEQLQRHRKCLKDNRAVWTVTGQQVEFVETPNSQLSGLPCCFEDHHDRNQRQVYTRETVTLHDLLRQHEAPERLGYLSIDTEGSELEILQAFDWSFHFQLITVEHNWVQRKRAAIRDLLESRGYRLAREVEFDDWYQLDGQQA
jgi:FkbM family methyltransferase